MKRELVQNGSTNLGLDDSLSEKQVDQLVDDLKQTVEIVKRTGLRARYDFTDALFFNMAFRDEWSVNSYFKCLDYDETQQGARVLLLERLIRSEDRCLFESQPVQMVEKILKRGGRYIGGGQFFLQDGQARSQHYEAAFISKSRLMLCLPTTISRV